MDGVLVSWETDRLLERWQTLKDHIESLIAEKGEERVLFSRGPARPAATNP